MTTSINRNKNTAIIVVLLIVCAVVFRILGNNGIYPITLGMLRTFIYIGLYIGWGVSVSKRIVQAQVRRNLVAGQPIKFCVNNNPSSNKRILDCGCNQAF